MEPDNARARHELGYAYIGAGNRELALREYQALKTLDPALATHLGHTLGVKP